VTSASSARAHAQDPYLTGRLATAFVRGLQGNDSTYIKARAPMFGSIAPPRISAPFASCSAVTVCVF
jgi:hypothetical protein